MLKICIACLTLLRIIPSLRWDNILYYNVKIHTHHRALKLIYLEETEKTTKCAPYQIRQVHRIYLFLIIFWVFFSYSQNRNNRLPILFIQLGQTHKNDTNSPLTREMQWNALNQTIYQFSIGKYVEEIHNSTGKKFVRTTMLLFRYLSWACKIYEFIKSYCDRT